MKETYLVTLEVTSETNPNYWNWDMTLNLDASESVYIHNIGQITRNELQENNKGE